ncbi:MAG: hypothetical protein D6730_24500 [Bacteroidetes bacterium]|nr:MAG: hypothetical protein D6730_24500 [Bacteroidota bacterium]
METFETIFGLLCLASVVVVFYLVYRGKKTAMEEMKGQLETAPQQPEISNEEAAEIARSFFQGYDGKAYRKYAKYVVDNRDLPLSLKPEVWKTLATALFVVGLMVTGLAAGFGAEGVVFNAIPIPGPLFQLLLLGVIIVMFWYAAQMWINRDAVLELGPTHMMLSLADEKFRIGYGNYQLLVTPNNKQFTLEFMSNQQEVEKYKKIIHLFPNKKMVPVLVTKAIEYGNFHHSTGMD